MPTLEEQNKTHGASINGDSNPPDPPSRNSSNSSITNNGVVDTNATTASSSTIPSTSKPPLPTTCTNSPENYMATAGNTQNNDDGKLIINHEHSDSLVHLLPTNLLDDSPTMSEVDPEEESPLLAVNTSENNESEKNMRDSINNNKEELAGESIDFDDDMAAAINNSSPPPNEEEEEGDTTSLSLSPGHDTVLQYSPTRTSDMMNTSYDVALQNGRVSPGIDHNVSKLQHPLHQKQPTGTHITEKELAMACAANEKQANNNQMTTLLDVLQEQRQQQTPSPENHSNNRHTGQQQLQQVKLSPIPSEKTTPSSAIRYLPTQTPANTPLHQPQIPQQQVQSLHPGRRSITLRLLEEIPPNRQRLGSGGRMSSPLLSSITNTPFKSLRRFRSLSLTSSGFVNATTTPTSSTSGDSLDGMGDTTTDMNEVDRGSIVVSWYEGTTSSEMTEHVFNCVLRKLNSSDSNAISSVPIGGKKKNGSGKIKLEDVRLLDDQEEVVLCPFLPDGSSFLLKFKIAFERPATPPRYRLPPAYVSEAPDSPSAEPSPHPSSADLPTMGNKESSKERAVIMQQNSKIEQQNEHQTQLLTAVAALLHQQQSGGGLPPQLNLNALLPNLPPLPEMPSAPQQTSTSPKEEKKEEDEPHTPIKNRLMPPTMAPISENSTTDQAIEHQLRQLNELFMQRRSSSVVTQSNEDTARAMNGTDENIVRAYHRDEKKQVIFVIANYLVLFMAMIAMSAEIQSRLPRWMEWVQQNYDSVQNCATDQAALMECLARGDLSGLIASFVLWATQSVFAQRIFLFGFDTPKKLWTVVYEALVTAVCWGISYLFIRRGLNPNTRQNFVHKYWKDAVYGSLAGFNAAFMKAVLKNLVPQDVALEALEGRQLRIFHWLGSFLTTEGLE